MIGPAGPARSCPVYAAASQQADRQRCSADDRSRPGTGWGRSGQSWRNWAEALGLGAGQPSQRGGGTILSSDLPSASSISDRREAANVLISWSPAAARSSSLASSAF